ncbi:MAG: hypothetical protein EPN33_08095 [Acidobacteria bacterium]|nr:MAG: hypothetical protein EPN33_08095 [Acidobacteriota bacterium]
MRTIGKYHSPPPNSPMSDVLELDAAILCGGLGTRLRGALPGLPKSLAPIAGEPFLDRLLEQLASAGCRQVVLCTGYKSEEIERQYGRAAGGCEIVFSPEPAPLGTGGALGLARKLLRTDPVLVMNGDSIVPGLDFAALRRAAVGAAGALVVVAADGRGDTGAITLDATGRVRGFAEKPAAGVTGYQSAGVYLLTRRLLGEIPEGEASSLERDWFPRWVGAGLAGYLHAGALIDIGTPERWQRAQEELR